MTDKGCEIVRHGANHTIWKNEALDLRAPMPRYLRWALIEATTNASRHELYRDRYQAIKKRLGKQRGAQVAHIDLARELSHAIWHMAHP